MDQPMWRAGVFGVDLAGSFPAEGLDDLEPLGAGRDVLLRRMAPEQLASLWPATQATRVGRQLKPALVLDHHPAAGYLLRTESFGAYLLSADGSSVACAPSPLDTWRWQRFLTAQVLPLAALLRGVEIYHASAVSIHGHAVAFVGDSGSGKSSLAVRLMLGGAPLVTDDVLAVSSGEAGVLAFPGPRYMNVRHAEHRLIRDDVHRLGHVVGRDSKGVRLRIEGATRPQRLGIVYLLNRGSSSGATRFSPVLRLASRRLLASTFNFAIQTPERLVNQLEVCAQITRTAKLFEIQSPHSLLASELAAQVRAHAAEVLGVAAAA